MNKPTDPKHLLTRVESLLRNNGSLACEKLAEVVEELEQHAVAIERQRKVADDFESLLGRNPSEEDIQKFLSGHPFMLGHTERYHISERVAEGVLAKFPISPDRIPDFVFISLALTRRQHPNRVDIFELKRADAKLFSTHNRQSKDLNDAWMEAVETQRLIGLNYADFIRRAVNEVLLGQGEQTNQSQNVDLGDHYSRPRLSVRILIGRRSSLSSEDMMRVRELGFSTNFSISVSTYDSLLDDLRGREHGETSSWRW